MKISGLITIVTLVGAIFSRSITEAMVVVILGLIALSAWR